MGSASPLMDLARVAVREAYGDPVTYSPQVGEPVTCAGIRRREAFVALDRGGAPVDAHRDVIDFIEADLDGLTARTGDSLTIGGSTYKVTHVEPGPVGTVVCTIGRG